ncbi:hypothetical protein MBLNU459_g2909t1 [Dothideomycetes sp. NU459]
MSDPDQQVPRNRKERRAHAKANNEPMPAPLRTTADIPMRQPDRSGPKGKTLYELAEERRAELAAQGQPFSKLHGDGQVRDESGKVLQHHDSDSDSDEPLGPLGESVFLTISLGMLHFTLDVLVYNQYRQEIEWAAIFARTGRVAPVLLLVVYALKSPAAMRFAALRQLFFLGVAVAAGCYLIHAGNTYAYYAVMKRAPPLGALWIWSVVEMKLPWALASVVVDVAFLLWGGYSAF